MTVATTKSGKVYKARKMAKPPVYQRFMKFSFPMLAYLGRRAGDAQDRGGSHMETRQNTRPPPACDLLS